MRYFSPHTHTPSHHCNALKDDSNINDRFYVRTTWANGYSYYACTWAQRSTTFRIITHSSQSYGCANMHRKSAPYFLTSALLLTRAQEGIEREWERQKESFRESMKERQKNCVILGKQPNNQKQRTHIWRRSPPRHVSQEEKGVLVLITEWLGDQVIRRWKLELENRMTPRPFIRCRSCILIYICFSHMGNAR